MRSPVKSDIGIVTPRPWGMSVRMMRPAACHVTPLATSVSSWRMTGGISSRNVNTTSDRRNGGITSRMT
jgi:hypothetical protein